MYHYLLLNNFSELDLLLVNLEISSEKILEGIETIFNCTKIHHNHNNDEKFAIKQKLFSRIENI